MEVTMDEGVSRKEGLRLLQRLEPLPERTLRALGILGSS